MLLQALCSISEPSVNWKWSYSPETPNLGQNQRFFGLCDLDIWWMTLKKKIGHLFYATSSFVHHFIAMCQFEMELQSGSAKFGSKSAIFLSRVTLIFDGWPCKTIGHLFYATSSFAKHFKAICQLKMELQSGNAKFGSKSAIFCPVWPWYLMDDLEKKNRAPLLCYFKLCASLHSHVSIRNGVTVRKRQIWVKIGNFFCPVWPWYLMDDLVKQ